MSLTDYTLTTVSIMLINAAVLIWLKRDLDEKLDTLSFKLGARCDNLGRFYGEMNEAIQSHKEQVSEDLVRALTKAETANQLAHQANFTAGKAKEMGVVRVKFEPMKMRIRQPKAGNA